MEKPVEHAWAFIHDGTAIVIVSSTIQDAANYYLSKYSIGRKDLHIVPVISYSEKKV